MPEKIQHPEDWLLNEYLDGELDASRQASLAAHLAACVECSRRLAEMETLFSSIKNLPDETPSHDLVGAVLWNLPRRPAAQRKRWILAAGTALQLGLTIAALIWLAPPAAWQNLPAGLGLAFQPPDVQLLLNPLVRSGLEGLNSLWPGWMNGVAQAWQAALAGFDQTVRTSWQTGLNQLPILELGVFGLAGAMVWLAGNGLLIGSLNRKSRRRNG